MEIIIEEIKMRRKKIEPKLIELDWRERWTWKLVEWYDVIQRTKKLIDSRQPKWKRIANKILKLFEAAIIIVAGYYYNKLPKIRI